MDGLKQCSVVSDTWSVGKSVQILLCFILILVLSSLSQAQETQLKVRKPVYAGSFYPAEKSTLERMLDTYLKEAEGKSEKIQDPIFGIIAPHAGYEYSGMVAASVYHQLKGKDYKTVILVGPSHYIPFTGIAIYPSGLWETPLGRVPIDHEIARILTEKYKSIKPFSPAFEREHSLEVQLPFLQKVLKNFKIVPLVTGHLNENDYKTLSEALFNLLKQNPKGILIVASSDMSHFHSYNRASKTDALTLRNIENLKIEELTELLEKGVCELCGAQAVITLMMVSEKFDGKVKVLNYANSGDVTGDKNRVVGYGAIAFYKSIDEGILNKKEQEQLLSLARNTLNEYVTSKRLPQVDIRNKKLQENKAVFVTLTKKCNLRGCVGYITPSQPLYKAVMEMTVAASARDTRFIPVTKEELNDIHIEISVLSLFTRIDNPDKIEIGKHGLYIVKGNRTGLLLPQVASSFLWSREEFLRQTCIKAGLMPNAWTEKDTEIYIFSAQIFEEHKK